MKSIFKSVFVLVAILSFQMSFAGGPDWKEMQAFHGIMAKTFHPAEEGQLKPVRDNADDLLAKAKVWKASAVPASLNKEQVTKSLENLVAKCDEIAKAVKANKSDDELKKLITQAHDVFHEVAEKCQPGDHGHDHGHEGHKH